MSYKRDLTDAFIDLYADQGELVTYSTPEGEISQLRVVPCVSQAEVDDGSGLMTTIDVQDFKLLGGDLTIGESTIVPERGHTITVDRDGRTVVFTVNHPNLNSAPFRRSDAYGVVLRVHSIQAEQSQDS